MNKENLELKKRIMFLENQLDSIYKMYPVSGAVCECGRLFQSYNEHSKCGNCRNINNKGE